MHIRYGPRGVTLLELLVVLAVVAVLFSLLLTALTAMRRATTELKSIAQVTRMCDTAIHVYVDLNRKLPEWFLDAGGNIRSGLNRVDGFEPRAFDDPFRVSPIAADGLLSRLGSFVDADHGTSGFGYLYVPLTGSVAGPVADPRPVNGITHPMWDLLPRRPGDPSWTHLALPEDTEYLLWGVGRDGVLDGDPTRDIVLIKTPLYPTLFRHQ